MRSESDKCFGCISRGPNTPTNILFFPCSMYAEPSAFDKMPTSSFTGLNSSAFRPSSLNPFLSINFSGFSFILYFLQFWFFFFKQLCTTIRQTGRVGFLLDFLNRLHGELFVRRGFPSHQDNAINTKDYLATRFLLNRRNHRTLPA